MPLKLTTAQFVEKAAEVHATKYNYRKVDYVNSHTKITIICPIHGDFVMKPNNHLNGQNCPKCAIAANAKARTKSLEQFLKEAKEKHGDGFDYSRVTAYEGAHKAIWLTHTACGTLFKTTPSSHLNSTTCMKCSVENMIAFRKKSNEEAASSFITTAEQYYELLTPYIQMKLPITVKHKPCGHVFTTTPDSIRVERCPCCAGHGFDGSKPGILYYICIDSKFYKIGITNRTIRERFRADELPRIAVINEWVYPNGTTAYQKEQEILKYYHNYKANASVLSSGNTEIFTTDVLAQGHFNENYFKN